MTTIAPPRNAAELTENQAAALESLQRARSLFRINLAELEQARERVVEADRHARRAGLGEALLHEL